MSKKNSENSKKPVISKNFKDIAIFSSIAISLASFLVTAIFLHETIYVASLISGILIAIIFLVIGIWKKRSWAIVASLSFFYAFAILGVSILGNWPGYLDMIMAGVIATIALLITTVFISILFAHKTWKKISKLDKLAIFSTYLAPFVILIGGYFCGLAMNLKLDRSNTFSSDIAPATSQEIFYGNIGSISIGLGVAFFVIINLMLIYTILLTKKNLK